MGIFDRLKNSALVELIRDPRLRELVTKREFRVSQEELLEEFVNRTADSDLQQVGVLVGEGFVKISGRIKKRFLPFSIPFSARLSLEFIEFSPRAKLICLKLEELKPLQFEWLTRRLLEKVPFLSYKEGLVTIHLGKIPRLAEIFSYRIMSFYLFDHIVLKDLTFRNREVVGRVGIML